MIGLEVLRANGSTLSAGALRAEEDLADRLRRGDPQAVREAYDAHHAAIRAFARRLVPDAAEDLVQEVFVTLPSAARRFRRESTLRTFLFSIAVNHARHFARAAARRRRLLRAAEPEPAGAASNPERDAGRRELAEALARALHELPLDQRIAFVLVDVQEKSGPEAAEIVGCPEATIRTRVFHARQKLREALEREGFR
jgi:RNA polymerase sigma-70 factor (ECF subfamily)